MQVIKTLTKERTVTVKKQDTVTIEIVPDSDSETPRSWSNLGTMLYLRNRSYTFGDREATQEEMQAILADKDMIALPMYAYMHGSVVMNTVGYSCPWDSAQVGIIFVSKEAIRKEWKVKRISAKLMETVLSNLRGEVNTYSQWLNGEVYGYRIKDESGEEIESCYGFYGVEEAEQEAIAAIPMEQAA